MAYLRRRRALAAVLALVVVVAGLAYGFRGTVAAALIPKIIGAATGTNVTFGRIVLHADHAEFTGVLVASHRGQRIAYIPRLDLTYDLRDVLPGSRHRFGLHSVVVYAPQVTIVHNRDGTYNIPAQAKQAASPRAASPLWFTARVLNGRVSVDDYTRVARDSQHLYVDGVNVNASVNTAATTSYVASLIYREGSHLYPIYGNGTVDQVSGLNLQHWSARRIPLPRIVNYGINNGAMQLAGGALTGIDVRYYGNLTATAYVQGAKVTSSELRSPIREGQGRLDVTGDAATTSGFSANLNGIPVSVRGGITDLSDPHIRFAIDGRGDASQLTKALAQTARLPVRGPIAFSMLAEGTQKAPLVLISVRSPQLDYKGTILKAPRALVAFDGSEADILNAGVGYRALTVGARGRISLKSGPHAVEMLAYMRGPSGDVPFASSVAPAMQLNGSVLAFADDLKKIDTRGVVSGTGSDSRLAGTFHVNSQGTGTAGPLEIDEPGRSLYARIAIDHPHNSTQALVSAQNFPVNYRGSAEMTGNVFAAQEGKALGMLGTADLHDARYGKIAISDAHARFGGTLGDVRVSSLDARGSFGTLHAAGTIASTNHVALEGRYAGSLSALAQIAGNMPATGSVDAPIALVYDGGRATAQIHQAHFSNASVRGVPIDGMSATIGTQGKSVRVYAARALVAKNARATATGTLGRGMALTVADLNMRALHGAGVPLSAGRANFAATVRGPITAPDVNGTLLLDRGEYDRYPIDAEGAIAYSGDTLSLRDGIVGLGPALIAIDGDVSGVRFGSGTMLPQYDLNATMRAADAHALIAMAQPALAKQDIQGSIDADVHVGGAGKAIAVNGNVSVPEGSVHGLAFRSMRAQLQGTPQDMRIGNGHVTIGSTAVAFDASAGSGGMSAAMRAPNADLADFNDYFDTGDTLAGTGRLALNAQERSGAIDTSGNVALQGVRFHRFDLGTANANWRTIGHTISLNAAVGGNSGRARLAGVVTVPPFNTVGDMATHADTNLNADVSDLDLGTWLPMMGYAAPVTGKLNAHAAVRGRFPDETIAANAAIQRGTVGRIQLQRAQLAVSASRGRGTITQALVQIPYLTANGSGTFGLHANDPLDLAMRATSPDVGALMRTVSGKPAEIAGALDTTLHVQGTRNDPRLTDSVALTKLQYKNLTIPRVSAVVAATQTQVQIRDGLVQFTRGRITASGTVPIAMKPHVQLDPANKPVRLAIAAENVDFSNFQSALPEGTRLAGTLGGTMIIGGTLDDPLLGGQIALHNGYFVGPVDQNPISKVNGAVVFSGTTVALQAAHADVGGGTMDLLGSAHLPNVRDIRAATFNARIVAKGAQFNSPQYFRGKVDADVTAVRTAPRAAPAIAGTVDLPSARIPLTAFWNPKAPQGPTKTLPDVALNLTAHVGNDVRVQSPNVDVGAQGAVTVGGSLQNPTLRGNFESTGGTVSFFRTFGIQSARVRFDPANGIMPFVNATATTTVTSPQTTFIALNVNGLAPDNLHVAFDSDPEYDQQQIMGLLAGIGGPSGPALAGAGDFSANSAVENLASGELNTFFTREMLEPLSAQLGSALGLQNLQLTDDFASGFGVSAAKAFGKHMTVVYDETMAQPKRQSLSIEAHRGQSSAFDLMFYDVQSPSLLSFAQTSNLLGFDNGAGGTLMQPALGSSGTSFLYEHKF